IIEKALDGTRAEGTLPSASDGSPRVSAQLVDGDMQITVKRDESFGAESEPIFKEHMKHFLLVSLPMAAFPILVRRYSSSYDAFMLSLGAALLASFHLMAWRNAKFIRAHDKIISEHHDVFREQETVARYRAYLRVRQVWFASAAILTPLLPLAPLFFFP